MIILDCDGSEQARDALGLGRLLPTATGARLIAASVYGVAAEGSRP